MKASRKLLWGVLVAAAVLRSADGGASVVDASGAGDFTEIQPALDAAVEGDVVLVAPGEYVIMEPLNFNRLHDPADPESPSVKNLKLQSQAGPQETIIRVADSPTDPGKASVIWFVSGEESTSLLQGFTLTGGQGTDYYGELCGGCVYCLGSAPEIRDCVIRGNHAHRAGGGVYSGNGSRARITACTISENVAPYGGGISFEGDCHGEVRHCIIDHNETSGIKAIRTELTAGPGLVIESCRIFRNRADGDYGAGGGLSLGGVQARIINCVIYKNEDLAGVHAGAMEIMGSGVTMEFCTIVGNRASGYAAGIWLVASNLRLTSTILWGNRSHGGDEDNIFIVESEDPYSVEASHCIIGGEPESLGDTSFDSDPLFAGPGIADFEAEWGDFHLRADSPAVNAGAFVADVETDIDGDFRSCAGEADIGADEDCLVQTHFRRGDGNTSGKVEMTDAIVCLGNLFLCFCPMPCREACDANDDGVQNITDAIFILNWLFLGGPLPPEPGPYACGPDPLPWGARYLGCDSYPSC